MSEARVGIASSRPASRASHFDGVHPSCSIQGYLAARVRHLCQKERHSSGYLHVCSLLHLLSCPQLKLPAWIALSLIQIDLAPSEGAHPLLATNLLPPRRQFPALSQRLPLHQPYPRMLDQLIIAYLFRAYNTCIITFRPFCNVVSCCSF